MVTLRTWRYGAKTSNPSHISFRAALAILRSSRSVPSEASRTTVCEDLHELVPVGGDADGVEEGCQLVAWGPPRLSWP